jgi:hypothetical protein
MGGVVRNVGDRVAEYVLRGWIKDDKAWDALADLGFDLIEGVTDGFRLAMADATLKPEEVKELEERLSKHEIREETDSDRG